MAYVNPDTVQLAGMLGMAGPDIVAESIAALQLGQYAYVLLPLNDHASTEAPGGSHWALLVYVRDAQTFYLCACGLGSLWHH